MTCEPEQWHEAHRDVNCSVRLECQANGQLPFCLAVPGCLLDGVIRMPKLFPTSLTLTHSPALTGFFSEGRSELTKSTCQKLGRNALLCKSQPCEPSSKAGTYAPAPSRGCRRSEASPHAARRASRGYKTPVQQQVVIVIFYAVSSSSHRFTRACNCLWSGCKLRPKFLGGSWIRIRQGASKRQEIPCRTALENLSELLSSDPPGCKIQDVLRSRM